MHSMVLARIVFVSTLFSGCDNNCDDEDMISLLIQRNLDHIICKIFREEKIISLSKNRVNRSISTNHASFCERKCSHIGYRVKTLQCISLQNSCIALLVMLFFLKLFTTKKGDNLRS